MNRVILLPLAGILLLAFSGAYASSKRPPFQPVTGFELSRYLGQWYEIARLPNWFEKDLVGVTAAYSLMKNGKVRVLNEGYKDSLGGKHKAAKGKAKFGRGEDLGHLKVSFFGPFYADYVIIDLAPDYSWALVASSIDYLWILSRTPALDKQIIDELTAKAASLGFEVGNLYFTPQKP